MAVQAQLHALVGPCLASNTDMASSARPDGRFRIDAQLFSSFALDLDGVVTNTAVIHAAAWKQLFDEQLARRAAGAHWTPFDDTDYRLYVDGKPRLDGLRSFLAARINPGSGRCASRQSRYSPTRRSSGPAGNDRREAGAPVPAPQTLPSGDL